VTVDPHQIGYLELGEGTVIAERYELAGVLGSGAEPVVFRARDFLTGNEIALKLFRKTTVQHPGAWKAFQRDLAILRDNSHPNVVRVFDVGEAAGTLYVAMELLAGEPLSSEVVAGSHCRQMARRSNWLSR
jgi:eukaryotic-like serine/threonine-protein kinase